MPLRSLTPVASKFVVVVGEFPTTLMGPKFVGITKVDPPAKIWSMGIKGGTIPVILPSFGKDHGVGLQDMTDKFISIDRSFGQLKEAKSVSKTHTGVVDKWSMVTVVSIMLGVTISVANKMAVDNPFITPTKVVGRVVTTMEVTLVAATMVVAQEAIGEVVAVATAVIKNRAVQFQVGHLLRKHQMACLFYNLCYTVSHYLKRPKKYHGNQKSRWINQKRKRFKPQIPRG